MEMNGGSSASYLARTPCVPLFGTLFTKGGNRRAFRLPGRRGRGSFPLYGGIFARSYSVAILAFCSRVLFLRRGRGIRTGPLAS